MYWILLGSNMREYIISVLRMSVSRYVTVYAIPESALPASSLARTQFSEFSKCLDNCQFRCIMSRLELPLRMKCRSDTPKSRVSDTRLLRIRGLDYGICSTISPPKCSSFVRRRLFRARQYFPEQIIDVQPSVHAILPLSWVSETDLLKPCTISPVRSSNM